MTRSAPSSLLARAGSFSGRLGARLALALGAFAWLAGAGSVVACSALEADAKLYTPAPADELGVVSYGGEQEACLFLDASKSSKAACVDAVRCSHGRAEAGAVCPDAGSAPAPFTTAESWAREALPGLLPTTTTPDASADAGDAR